MTKPVFRNGMIHVRKAMCETCIFRPGNLMRLEEGCVEGMVKAVTKAQSCIPCHKTILGEDERGEAVCRGFYEKHPTAPLQLAAAMGKVRFQ